MDWLLRLSLPLSFGNDRTRSKDLDELVSTLWTTKVWMVVCTTIRRSLLRHENPYQCKLRLHAPLLHLQTQQVGLGTAWSLCVLSSRLVEGITALIEGIDLGLAFLLLVRVLRETCCKNQWHFCTWMLYGGNHLVWHTGNCQSCTKRMFCLWPTARGWQGGSNAMSSLSPPCYLLLSTQTGVSGYTHTMTQYTILSQKTGNKTESMFRNRRRRG